MNENDFLILLQAKLDEAKSEGNINKDIDTLQKKLDKLKLQVTIDPNAAQSLVKEIEKVINRKITISNIAVDTSQAVRSAQKTGQQIGQVISDSAEKAVSSVSSKSIGKYFKVDASTSAQFKAEMEKLVSDWTDAKGKLTDIKIDTRTSFDKDAGENIERLHQATVTYKNELNEVIKKTIAWRQIGTTTNSKGEEVAIRGFVEVAGQYSKSLDTVSAKTDTFVEKQKKATASAQNTLSSIESKLNDPNISKSLSGTDFNANGLNAQLERVKSAISVLGNANKDTFTQAQIDVNKEITSLNNLISTLKNAEYAATSLRTKDINTVKIDEGNNLNAFVQKMGQSGHYTDELKQKVENLRTQLNGVFDANTLTSYLNGLSNLQSEFKSVDATAKTLEKSTKLQTNVEAEKKILQVYTNELKAAGILTDDVKEKIQNMFYSLSKVDSQNGLTTWRAELKGVKTEIDAVLKSVTQEKLEEEKLANTMAAVREKTEQARQAEEKRQQLAQNKAVNKALEDEYKQRQKLAEITRKKADEIQLSIETNGYDSKVKSLISRTQQWTDEFGNARISTTKLSESLNALTNAGTAYAENPSVETAKALADAESKLDIEIRKVTNSVKSRNSEFMKSSAVDSLRQKYQDFYDKNSASHRQWGAQLKQGMLELASGAEISKRRGEELKQELIQIQNAARQAGKLGKSGLEKIFEGFKVFGYWTSPTFLFMKAFQSIKSGISTVRELDTALVDLKKTTTMTASELEDFYYASNDAAKQMGVTTKEILEQAAAWSRLGFSTAEQATKMAQLSSQFASISPGMSTDEAQEGLVSIIKAWGLDVSEVEREVMDNINTLGNRFAESNADLVAGMKRSAAALAATGTTYQDAFALFTGAQEVLQNAEAGGRALRSISMRIHGYSENSEDGLAEVDEELKNITGDLIDLTKTAEHTQGVSIFKEGSTTEFKSLVQYFGEINEIWDEMTQKQQNDFLEKAFGKNQAQSGAAIIQNYKAVTNAIEAMENAAGSSEREMSIIAQSLDFKLNRLSETGTSVAQNLFKRDDMKTVVDGLTSVMNVIDRLTSRLGLFGSIGLGAGLFAGFKNIGKCRMSVRISNHCLIVLNMPFMPKLS